MAVAEQVEDMEIVATVEDGMGDYLVWLQNDDEGLWGLQRLRQANDVFEAVDYPAEEAPGGSARGQPLHRRGRAHRLTSFGGAEPARYWPGAGL